MAQGDDDEDGEQHRYAQRFMHGGIILPPPSPSLASSAYSSRCATPRGGGGGSKALHLHSPPVPRRLGADGSGAAPSSSWSTTLRASQQFAHGAGAATPRSGLASPLYSGATARSMPGSPSGRSATSTSRSVGGGGGGAGRRTEPGSPAGAGMMMAATAGRRPPFYPSSHAPVDMANNTISVFSASPASSRGGSTIGSPRSVSSRGTSGSRSRRAPRPDKINGRTVKWTTPTS